MQEKCDMLCSMNPLFSEPSTTRRIPHRQQTGPFWAQDVIINPDSSEPIAFYVQETFEENVPGELPGVTVG